MRGSFLCFNLDLSSLDALNKRFTKWVEDEYNAREHSEIFMKPIDRFGLDRKRIRYLTPSEMNDEVFMREENRKVKKDNTFPFKKRRFEAPRDLRKRQIQIRFDDHKPDRVICFFKGERMGEAKLLNRIANDRPPKELKGEHS